MVAQSSLEQMVHGTESRPYLKPNVDQCGGTHHTKNVTVNWNPGQRPTPGSLSCYFLADATNNWQPLPQGTRHPNDSDCPGTNRRASPKGSWRMGTERVRKQSCGMCMTTCLLQNVPLPHQKPKQSNGNDESRAASNAFIYTLHRQRGIPRLMVQHPAMPNLCVPSCTVQRSYWPTWDTHGWFARPCYIASSVISLPSLPFNSCDVL